MFYLFKPTVHRYSNTIADGWVNVTVRRISSSKNNKWTDIRRRVKIERAKTGLFDAHCPPLFIILLLILFVLWGVIQTVGSACASQSASCLLAHPPSPVGLEACQTPHQPSHGSNQSATTRRGRVSVNLSTHPFPEHPVILYKRTGHSFNPLLSLHIHASPDTPWA